MLTPPAQAGAAVAVAILLMTVTWLAQGRTRNAGWVDVVWTALVGVLALLHAVTGSGNPGSRLLLAFVALAWSLRLASHLAQRVAGGPEEARYAELRQAWGPSAGRNMLVFFLAQGVLAVLLATSFQVVAHDERPLFVVQGGLALLVAAVALGGEALADRQLARFKARPDSRGRTCRDGLWAWSRHPNYFFEWVHWFVYPVLAFGASWWPLTLVAPALMLLFLLRVTGIPATEARALVTRGEDYRAYQRSTSAFIPWPPRRAGSA